MFESYNYLEPYLKYNYFNFKSLEIWILFCPLAVKYFSVSDFLILNEAINNLFYYNVCRFVIIKNPKLLGGE